MEYRNKNTGEIISEKDFRSLFNHEGATSWGRIPEDYVTDKGFEIVHEGPQAEVTTVYQYSMRYGIEQKNGKWYTKYILGPVFSEYTTEDGTVVTVHEQEVVFKNKKDEEQVLLTKALRDEFLRDVESKVQDLNSKNVSVSVDLQDYIQALRDIESQEGFPWNIVWPKQP